MTKKSFGDRTISFKYITYFIAPILLGLLVGYIYLMSTNRSIEAKMASNEQTLGALEGEVYRLKQAVSQRDAKMKYLLDGSLKRFKLYTDAEEFTWLFYRETDGAWYVEVTHASVLPEGVNYKLVIGDSAVGEFEKIADAVGLQKVGEAKIDSPIRIYSGPRGQSELNSDWVVLYDSVSPEP